MKDCGEMAMDRARAFLPLVRTEWETAFTIAKRSTASASQITRGLAQLAEARLIESKSVNNGNRTVMMYRAVGQPEKKGRGHGPGWWPFAQ